MKTVAIIGAGYVGLVTGACLAQKGIRVVVIENNLEKIAQLTQGEIPFYEPHLQNIVTTALCNKTLFFENNIEQGLWHNPTIIFLCVGTPSLENGAVDLSYVENAAQEIGKYINQYTLIVNKSTVPVGTAKKVKAIISHMLMQRKAPVEFDVASNPEFLKEGSAVNDFIFPDRIVVGVESEHAAQLLFDLYKTFITDENQFICMNPESAELTKYASNTMLAMRISFMNQLAHLADKVGADIELVKQGMAKDKRIGQSFLNAGVGYGGSCFPKDVKALIHMGVEHHFPMTLAQNVDNINQFQRIWFINRIRTYYGASLTHKTVGIWGLSFKPETDDIRCAPAIEVINDLLLNGIRVIAYDPIASDNVKKLYGNHITFASNAKDVLVHADCLVILTEWKEFLSTNLQEFLQLKDKVIFDGRNIFDPHIMHALGITYLCVGRNNAHQNMIENIQRTVLSQNKIISSI